MTRLLVALMCILSLPRLASARFMAPTDAPVDRLIQNVEKYIKEHPDDAMGYYTLARIHHLAFTIERETLRVWNRGEGLPTIPRMFNRPTEQKAPEKPETLQPHLLEGVRNFNLALEKDPKNALFHLGLASLLDAALLHSQEFPPIPGHDPKEQVKDWKPVYLKQAIQHYLQAYDLSIKQDAQRESLPLQGLSELVSYEAGTRYLELAKLDGVDPAQKQRVEEVQKGVEKLQKLPHGPITPILFTFSQAQRLDDLLDPHRTVKFDLDGTGRGQSWPWVQPQTGILVWDPAGTGRIESGRQLFGSVTWWMFWRDGYSALDALDDNRDGRLSGDELRGLAVWFDANGNGRCEPGEVTPLASLSVESLETRWTSRDGVSPCNPAGLHLKDGRTIATWDWVVEPSGR